MTEEKEDAPLTYDERMPSGEIVKRPLAVRLAGMFTRSGVSEGKIVRTKSYVCRCGAVVNARDRKAKRYHSPKRKEHGA